VPERYRRGPLSWHLCEAPRGTAPHSRARRVERCGALSTQHQSAGAPPCVPLLVGSPVTPQHCTTLLSRLAMSEETVQSAGKVPQLKRGQAVEERCWAEQKATAEC